MNKASEVSLNMGVWLGRAQPGKLDDAGVLTLEFEPGADNAITFFKTPRNRETLEAFLRAETENVTSFQLRQTKHAAKATGKKAQHNPSTPAQTVNVNHEQLLKDAGIAAVVEEFRGVIVDVKNKRDA